MWGETAKYKSLFTFLIFLWGATQLQAKPIRIGLVLDRGGRDDKSFNASAYRGATEAKEKLGIQLKTVTASDDTSIEPALRKFAQRKFDLIIGIGFAFHTGIQKVSKSFPKSKFLLVDANVNAPNVRSILFEEHEGSYLVGAIAGLTTKTNVIGFVGGMPIPLIKRFKLGYEAGVKAVNPKATILSKYVGSGSDAWRNPTKGKELALAQYRKNADIIFAAAGSSGLGVFDAAEEQKKLAIGVDSNQNWVKPGYILTSMIKRVDLAVYRTIEGITKKEFKPGVFSWGIKEGAIGFSVDQHNRAILKPKVEKRVNQLKEQLKKKQIKVPDFYEINKTSLNRRPSTPSHS